MAVVRGFGVFRCSIYYVTNYSIDEQGVQCIFCNITINEFNYFRIKYFEKWFNSWVIGSLDKANNQL